MTDFIELNGNSIGLGEDIFTELKLARLPSFETIKLPIYIFRAPTDGPVLLLTAGMHGDEINGVETIRRMIKHELIKPQKGTIIAVPLINIFGFIQKDRDLPDGKDINRSFPGSKNGSLARLVAHTLMKQIVPLIDYGIDFHTGGQSRENYPQIRCKLDMGKNKELAEAFSPPVIVNSSFIDHSFRQAAHNKEKQILLFESGETNRFYEPGIKEGISGTLRLMKYLGMLPKAPQKNRTDIYNKSTWIRAESAGMFNAESNLGTTVEKKDCLGFISDPYGNEHIDIKSSEDGRIIGLNNSPVIHKGDALVHIAYDVV